MPDHDQRRANLPGDGAMYCVPTSTYNIIDYLANHGIPSLKIDPNSYKNVTSTIDLLGQYMETDAANGTYQSKATIGFKKYIGENSDAGVTYTAYFKDKNYMSPNVWLEWMKLGGLVTLCYGYYSNPEGQDKVRNGGHCMTLSSVQQIEHDNPLAGVAPWVPNTYNTYQLGFKNPASDEGPDDSFRLKFQSANVTDLFDLHVETANFDGTESTLYGIGEKPANAADNYTYIDCYQAILPNLMLRLNHDYRFQMAVSLDFDPNRKRYNPAGIREINYQTVGDPRGDYALDPIAPAFVRTQTGSKRIYQTDFFGHQSRVIGVAKNIILNLEYGGPDLDLFVLQRDRLSVMHRDGEWGPTARFNFQPEAMAYDSVHGYIYVVGGSELVILNKDLRKLKQQTFRELFGDLSMRQFLRVDPSTGDIYSLRRGENELQKFTMTDKGVRFTRSIPLQGLSASSAFDIAPNGHIMVSEDGVIRQFQPTGRQVRTSSFAGLEVGNNFRMSRDFSNYDERRYPVEQWHDVRDPAEPLGRIR